VRSRAEATIGGPPDSSATPRDRGTSEWEPRTGRVFPVLRPSAGSGASGKRYGECAFYLGGDDGEGDGPDPRGLAGRARCPG